MCRVHANLHILTYYMYVCQVLADPIQILHVNEDFVVVNKPASIPVHPVGRFKVHNIKIIILFID